MKNALADFLPKRLAERWLELHSSKACMTGSLRRPARKGTRRRK